MCADNSTRDGLPLSRRHCRIRSPAASAAIHLYLLADVAFEHALVCCFIHLGVFFGIPIRVAGVNVALEIG